MQAAGGGAVRAALDLQARRVRRDVALRWALLNAVLLAALVYDLWWWCPSAGGALRLAEAALAAAAAAALLRHALQLLPAGSAAAPALLSHEQMRLLGLKPQDLDSSFRLVDAPDACAEPPPSPPLEGAALSLSLSRSWSPSPPPSPPTTAPSPHSPPSPPSLHSSRSFADDRDEFISDRTSLTEYLKQYEARASEAAAAGAGGAGALGAWLASAPPPAYRRACTPLEGAEGEERGGGGDEAAWWRLPLAPRRLAAYNLNLRLWLHVTILARLARQLAAADEELARRALPDHALGQVSVEQLRALGRECGAVRALLPYLAPVPDQRHLVARLRQLASGPCLSNYKWDGVGGDKLSDAEIILHLFATYLDGQVGGACGGACAGAGAGAGGGACCAGGGACCAPFSAAHLWPPPGGVVAGAGAGARPALALHRVTQRPPHYVLVHNDHTIDVGRGRNNLLHSLLVFLALAAPPPAAPAAAAAAAAPSPALRRLQLGPAGVNILWVIGR